MSSVADAWTLHAPTLAAWVLEQMVNRQDAFGHYLAIHARSGESTAFTDKSPLTLATLQRHFEGRDVGDLIGLHSTTRGEDGSCWCRWPAIDIDRHDEATDPARTLGAALSLHDHCVGLGLRPLLTDSNGAGGYHLVVPFERSIPARDAFRFGKWLRRDWKELGLDADPEVFPKQPSIPEGGFGNWLRLPGRHHTRDHWSKVWDGSAWLEGRDAVLYIVESGDNDPSRIPAEALADPAPPPRKARTKSADPVGDLALASRALEYLDPSMAYPEWLEVGMSLTPLGRDGLHLWDSWSSESEKYREGLCDRKWRSFNGSGRTLGSLFHMAKTRGFEFPKGGQVRVTFGANGHRHDGQPGGGDPGAKDHPDPPPDDDGPPGGRGEPPPAKPDDRAPVEVNTRRFEVVENSIKALASDPDLYRRGDQLVSVIREESDIIRLTSRTTMEGVAGSPKIVDLSDAVIGDRLTRSADFYQWKKDRSGEFVSVPAHPPDWLIKTVATRKHWPGIRPLVAVAECPFPRHDGTIVEEPGYDVATATLYLPTLDYPRLVEAPTRADAEAAWGRLKGYVGFFPFASEDDRVVFLAGVLNVIARNGIPGPVPGIAVIGNRASTGKGLLIDAMSIPGTGRPAPTSNYPDDKEEAGKVKVAIALSGNPVVHFDNLDEGSGYGNSALDSALTAISINDRILGSSKNTGDILLRLSWFLSGNNIWPGKDAYRRWLVCNLVTEHEHPERRADLVGVKPLRAQMLGDRAEIVRDALTILKAHALARWPKGEWALMGTFEEWDRIVRGAVWFATGLDCLATQYQMAEESPERQAKLALLEGWRELSDGGDGCRGVTTAKAIELAMGFHGEASYPTLRSALMRYGVGGKVVTSRALGNILRGINKTPIAGLRLEIAGEEHKTTLWRAVTNSPYDKTSNTHAEGGSGGSGGCYSDDLGTDSGNDYDVNGSEFGRKKARRPSQKHPPDPPDPPLNLADVRARVATWDVAEQEQFRSNRDVLRGRGMASPEADFEAYRRMLDYFDSLRNQPSSAWD